MLQTPVPLASKADHPMLRDEVQVETCFRSTRISASTPVHRFVAEKTATSPHLDLGEDFARGWRKLPDELKIEILCYNLVSGNKTCVSSNMIKRPDLALGKMLRHHLALGPELAALSQQVFYGKNTIEISTMPWRTAWPPVPVRANIHRLSIDFLSFRAESSS